MRGVTAFLIQHIKLTALAGAAALHVMAFGIILSLPRPAPVQETVIPIAVTLYEAPPPKLEPVPQPEPIDAEQSDVPITTPLTQPPAPVTSLTKAPDQTETIVQQPEPSPLIDNAPVEDASSRALMQAADILKRADCNRLTRERPDDCPPSDPFASAAALQDLQNPKAPISIPNLQAFGPQGMAESYLSARGWKPSMPGPGSAEGLGASSLIDLGSIDNTTFIDPMAKGAYNAQRIRNGETPIWDKEVGNALKDARSQR